MKKALVLLSGGIDSATTMAIARAEGYSVYALSFHYGQRHAIELEAAKRVAEHLGAEKRLVIDFNLREIGGSALTAAIDVPKDTNQKAELTIQNPEFSTDQSVLRNPQSVIPATYVPARNTIFLSFALGWAEVLEAADIFIGANAVDYSGYPDCRPGYLKAFEDMANLATKVAVEGTVRFSINAPLLQMTKGEIIRRGTSLGLDYGLTWSCYDPQETSAEGWKDGRTEAEQKNSGQYGLSPEDFRASELPGFRARYKPCGHCDSCLFRKKGFAEVGLNDPALQ
ncbi:MAG TPA: 7-cyano-7-deazaguanine synthase QueC [Dissulfurispiraceae bacterium]|nr:7-cyano-7-deazaguanine synthase QueC [Dissulfurispiraceae bacterium]